MMDEITNTEPPTPERNPDANYHHTVGTGGGTSSASLLTSPSFGQGEMEACQNCFHCLVVDQKSKAKLFWTSPTFNLTLLNLM